MVYAFKVVNKFGGTVVYVKYQAMWTYGGSYTGQDGLLRGKYLTGDNFEKVRWDTSFEREKILR